jgi:hypothetical protein
MYIASDQKAKNLIEKFGKRALSVADEILEATKTYDWRTNKYNNYWLEVKFNIEKTLKETEHETNVG